MFFFDPTQIAAGEAPADKRFRLGGMVKKGSVQRTPGTLDVQFLVTDFKHTVPVQYSGVLPDLFREGQGVVAHGRMHATASSSPTRCSPSTTRNTCRPRWPSRSRTIAAAESANIADSGT